MMEMEEKASLWLQAREAQHQRGNSNNLQPMSGCWLQRHLAEVDPNIQVEESLEQNLRIWHTTIFSGHTIKALVVSLLKLFNRV